MKKEVEIDNTLKQNKQPTNHSQGQPVIQTEGENEIELIKRK